MTTIMLMINRATNKGSCHTEGCSSVVIRALDMFYYCMSFYLFPIMYLLIIPHTPKFFICCCFLYSLTAMYVRTSIVTNCTTIIDTIAYGCQSVFWSVDVRTFLDGIRSQCNIYLNQIIYIGIAWCLRFVCLYPNNVNHSLSASSPASFLFPLYW